jgi:hypothetical protein
MAKVKKTQKYYDSVDEVSTKHLEKNSVERRSDTLPECLTMEDLRDILKLYPDNALLTVKYDNDYYSYVESHVVEWSELESDDEFTARKLQYQKAEYKKHRRPTAEELETQRLAYEVSEQKKKDILELNRIKKLHDSLSKKIYGNGKL